MRFSWDEKKRAKVRRDHGIDVLEAALILANEAELEVWEDPRYASEKRFTAIGRAEGVWYCLVYEERGDTVRLITGWKLNDRSKRRAEKRLARRAARYEGPG